MNYRKTIAVLMGMSLSVGMLTGCAQQDAGLGMLLVNPMPVAKAFDDKTSTAPSTVDAYPVDMTYTQYAVLEEVAVEEPATTEPEAAPETKPPQTAQAPASSGDSGGGHSGDKNKKKNDETKPAETQPAATETQPGNETQPTAPTEGGGTPPATEGPAPTEAPKPTESPKPADTPTPTEGPKPTESPQPAETPKPAESPKTDEGGTPEKSESPAKEEAFSVRNIPVTSENGAPQWVVFRYQSSENEFHYQLAQGTRVVTCVAIGDEVHWQDGVGKEEELPRLERMILQNTQWLDCAADGIYAEKLEMQFSTKMGDFQVLFVDYNKQNGQMQFYSEDGDLLECWSVSAMPPEAKLMESVDVDWSPNTHVELKVDALVMGETGQLGKIPQLSGLTQKKTAKLPAWSVAVMVVLAVVAVGLAVAVILLLKRKPAKAQKRAPEKVQEQPVPSGPKVAALHNIGRRSGQQDSFDVVPCAGGLLAVVADGMGGLSDGDKVSKKIVSTFHEDAARVRPGQSIDALYQMLAHANQEVNRMLGTALQGKCGSTLLAVLMEKDRMQWTAVGDSRIYLYRGGSLIQVNREHTYKIDLLERAVNGEMSFADLRKDAQLTRLCSYMGMGRIKHVDGSLHTVRLLPGDRILLMSDGVFNTLSEEEIAGVLSRFDDVEQAAAVLEKKVLEKNSPTQDNFTCVILKP